jgi:hypothetical protein
MDYKIIIDERQRKGKKRNEKKNKYIKEKKIKRQGTQIQTDEEKIHVCPAQRYYLRVNLIEPRV